MTESRAETVVEGIYKDMERRIAASLRASVLLTLPGHS